MEENHVWHAERGGRTRSRTPLDHRAHVSAAGAERPDVPHRRHRRSPTSPTGRVTPATASDPLNCYEVELCADLKQPRTQNLERSSPARSERIVPNEKVARVESVIRI